jgi:hypothetical protein
MEFLDYWINSWAIRVLPEGMPRRPIKIRMPTECPICKYPIKLLQPGSKSERSYLTSDRCEHVHNVSDAWAMCKEWNELCLQCGEVH